MIVKETKDLPDYKETYIRTNINNFDILIILYTTCDEYTASIYNTYNSTVVLKLYTYGRALVPCLHILTTTTNIY
jgi:hypothetical protein